MLSVSYAGLYPVLDASVFYGGRSSTYDISMYYGLMEETVSYRWRELRPSLGITLPFNLTRSRFDTKISVGVRGSYIRVTGMNFPARYYTPERNHNGGFIPLTYYASFYNGYRWFADINPVWGQSVDIAYRHTPFRGNTDGALFSISGTLWFPGILRHHSLFFQGGFERQYPHDYRFPARMRFARGYTYEFSETTWKACANYLFPLFNPDWNLVHVIHFKRFYANLFGDYAMREKAYYRSAGLELYSELRLFTIETPLILGVRGYYRFDRHHEYRHPYGFDFIFGFGSISAGSFQAQQYL
ncbi:MAG: hypothetical protein JXA07_14360, partial [Spirochaetes bacterium]|nr:hypothetical protein [Spirochaetota bacterium]